MTKPDSVLVKPLRRLALPEKMEIATGTEFKFRKERVIKHLQNLSLSLSPRALVPPFELALIHDFGSHENSASAAAATSFDLGEIYAADVTASQPLDRPEIGDRDRPIGSDETPDRIAGHFEPYKYEVERYFLAGYHYCLNTVLQSLLSYYNPLTTIDDYDPPTTVA
ncbi:hypothetical protein M5K25_023880 [Dendrobium thyrsiflorum]|uniref:Uncharacterized protein n=1 Tax=Dendrobium thyrsiflorum TaxID=117978 RepID=A0ABD0U0X0_DENTH